MISLIHQGIIAAAGGLAQVFQLIPSPLFLNGQWWSFIDQDSGSTSTPDPVVSSLSASATDISSFTEENVTTGVTNGGEITAIGNGKVLRQFSTSLLVKDLTVPAANWASYSLTSIPGGHIAGGSPVISFAPGPGLFILHKSGKDIYSSADAVTWTAYDPVSDNQLSTLMEDPKIFHNGSTYVAIGHPVSDTSQLIFATSSDLSTWTSAGSQHAVANALFIRFFEYKGKFFYIPISAALPVIHSSTDLISWSPLYTPTTNVSLLSSRSLVTNGRLSFLGSKEIYTEDGLTFSERLPVINLEAVFSEEPYSSLRGTPVIENNGIASYPTFLAFRQNESTENGGRLYSVDPLTFSPTLEIPSGADYGNIIGLCGLVGTSVIGPDNFTFGGDLKYGYYAKNNNHGNTYFEIKVLSKTADDGEFGLVAVFFTNDYQPAGKKVGVYLRMNGDLATYNETLSTVTLTNITTSLVADDIIGFLFNGVSETLEIYRNGSLLTTVNNLATSAYSFSQRLDGTNCRLNMNIGQDPFVYTPGSFSNWGTL